MENGRRRLLSSILGAASGAGGLASYAACTGGSCLSCFGCAAVGLGVILATLVGGEGAAAGTGRKNSGADRSQRGEDIHGVA